MSYAQIERLEESRFQSLPLYGLQTLEQLLEVLEIDANCLAHLVSQTEQHYHCFYKTQANGKKRLIEAPSQELKMVQHRIRRIFKQESPPPYLSSPVNGRSHISNASVHRHRFEVICLDIAQFFRSCTNQSIFQMFREKLLCSLEVSGALTELVCFQDHLATGSPCSPLIAFYVNEEMFNGIYVLMGDFGCRISLWVDDLAMSIRWEHIGISVQTLIDIVQDQLSIYGFCCNPLKTKIYLPNRAAEITGIIVTPKGELRMPNRLHLKLKQTNERIKTAIGMEKQKLKQRSKSLKQLQKDINSWNKRTKREKMKGKSSNGDN